MKLEFELTLDNKGVPCIKFRHHDKSSDLEQRVLKSFLDMVKEKGIEIVNTNGYIGYGSSYENYEIKPITT